MLSTLFYDEIKIGLIFTYEHHLIVFFTIKKM